MLVDYEFRIVRTLKDMQIESKCKEKKTNISTPSIQTDEPEQTV